MDDDEDDDDEVGAEDGYEKILREQQLGDRDDSGPSARDIEARRRHDEMLYVAPLFPNILIQQRRHSRLCLFSSSRDEEDMVEYFRRKYADTTSTTDIYGDGEDMADEISQQGLLPGVK